MKLDWIFDTINTLMNLGQQVETVYLGPMMWNEFFREYRSLFNPLEVNEKREVKIYDIVVKQISEKEYFHKPLNFEYFGERNENMSVNVSNLTEVEQKLLRENLNDFYYCIRYKIKKRM